MKKPTRTISGVAPLAVMLPPRPCPHGYCTFCPALKAPQSYTPESPVVLRAAQVNFSAYEQVVQRLSTLQKMGHVTDKVELIIMGGTFLSYPLDFQEQFIKACYDALNDKISKTLVQAKNINETAKHRCVALCIETRPDVCSLEDIKRMRSFGCTRVELGVQMPDDALHRLTKRGHTVKDVVLATKHLKQSGFKVGYHLMPGLPGSSLKKDLMMFNKVFSDERFKPDQIKIYPCQVLLGSELAIDYAQGKYIPYTLAQTKQLILSMLMQVPEYCRVMRIMREIPKAYLVAGIDALDLRKTIEDQLKVQGTPLNEIRFREIRFSQRKDISKLKIDVLEYQASGGKELFIQFIDDKRLLYGLARLRLENKKSTPAMIRELHVYGQSASLGEQHTHKAQHKGFGKALLQKAETIAREHGYTSIKIISGVGVRAYYHQIGYRLDEQEYMSKSLK